MTRKIRAGLAVLAAMLALLPAAAGAAQTGSVNGRILDGKGTPQAGAYLYLASPAMAGISNFMTSKTGRFMFHQLPPGAYQITVELPGYKITVVEDIVVVAGGTAVVKIVMEPAESEDETASAEPGPPIDRKSARNAVDLDREILTRVPASRDFRTALGLVPGFVFESELAGYRASVHGAPVTANTFATDGADVTNPVSRESMSRINVDVVDQVVVETAGRSIDTGPAQGAYVNVVHRSGGNDFQGSLSLGLAGKALAQPLWSDEEISSMGAGPLVGPKGDFDLSLTAGGPVLKDTSWFFGNIRFRAGSRNAPFKTWTTPTATQYFPFRFRDTDLAALFKLSASVAGKFKGFAEFDLSRVYQPYWEPELAWNRPKAAMRKLAGERLRVARGAFSYNPDQRTLVDISMFQARYGVPLLLNAATEDSPQYYDLGTGYSWGSGSLNERDKASRFRVAATVARSEERFLGIRNELLAGGEYETLVSESQSWKNDNLVYNYFNGSPYLYGESESPGTGELVGFGLVSFWIAPKNELGLAVRREAVRTGFFVRDTLRFGDRVSLSAGLRFDRSESRILLASKSSSGNALSQALGAALISPVLGINPYGSFNVGDWDKPFVWTSYSPHFGLTIDLLGTGRTVLKSSYSRRPEEMGLGYAYELTPIDHRRLHSFYWYDEDGNGLASTGDTFFSFPEDYRVYRPEFYRQAVDPDLTPPLIEEWTAGLEQEIARDFTLSLRYVSRTHTNLVGNVLYDPSTGAPWSRIADSPEGWWVPFSTVVPGIDGYPDVPVTVHYRSATAPLYFERIENIPELGARYRGLELTLRKRMSRNWQFLGSVVWSRLTGTTGLASIWSVGGDPGYLTPNSFVNYTDSTRLLQDRPLSARMMGTVRFKWDIFLSLSFRAQSGAPWARTVSIIPPQTWALANGADRTPVTVYLEDPGTRRYRAWKNLDLRVEKEFMKLGRIRYTASLDVLNLLGDRYRILDLNDGGFWTPEDEGTSAGERTLSRTYDTYLPYWGIRAVRINLSLRF